MQHLSEEKRSSASCTALCLTYRKRREGKKRSQVAKKNELDKRIKEQEEQQKQQQQHLEQDARKKKGSVDKEGKLGHDDGSLEEGDDTSEKAKADRRRENAQSSKRAEEQLKMMFEASVDPFEKPLRWWECPHVKYAFSHSAVKSRLESLMGSNIVRLTDRKYMLALIKNIREQHENRQAIRIEKRKERELMRTKSMILNRFMTVEEAPPEILEYPLFKLYQYCDTKACRPQNIARPPRRVKISESLYRLLYPDKLLSQVEIFDDLSMSEEGEGGEESGSQSEGEMEEGKKKKHSAEPVDEYMFTREEYDNLHFESDSIKKLREIKSVNAMYAKADSIVGVLFSLVTKAKVTEDK